MLSSRTRIRRGFAFSLAASLTVLCACSDRGGSSTTAASADQWLTFGGGLERNGFNAAETRITAANVASLIPRWRFLTGAVVTAAPVIADVASAAGPGSTVKTVFIPSWDGFFYALRADSGDLLWSYKFKTQPGAEFVQGSSGVVADIDGRRMVFVANGETMYAFEAASGQPVWQFDAGTGCTTCDRYDERNEILSPPAVFDGVIYFGMDVNEIPSGKGGLYALDVRSGTLKWYFDLATGSTCRPNAGDQIRRFDGFHSTARLGLSDDFLATRAGCSFDRTPDGCSAIYGAVAVDTSRNRLFVASTNCEPDESTAGAASPYNEAIFSLTTDGTPLWSWRPRVTDPRDLDFGVGPNLFRTEIDGQMRDVVGVGGKDGTYYLFDRQGVNALTGKIEPYWLTNVVYGGAQGGIMATPVVADGRVLFSTGLGEGSNDETNFQRPAAHALVAATGSILWQNAQAPASFSPPFAVPGVVFMGSFGGTLYAYDWDTGNQLAQFNTGSVGLYSQAVVVDGQLYVGSGTGARVDAPEDIAFSVSEFQSPVSAYCIAGDDGCPQSGACIDSSPCTVDSLGSDGSCSHTPAADGTPCRVGAYTGTCTGGGCDTPDLDCDDGNACTIDTRTLNGCRYASVPDGTPCLIRGEIADTCHAGACGTEPREGSHPF